MCVTMRCMLRFLLVFGCVVLVKAQCPRKCVCTVASGSDVLTNCSNAQLADVPRDEFDDETMFLDLSWNLIGILRNHTFLDRRLYTIEKLDLSNNKYLSSIESSAFEAMGALKHLDLSFDDLAELSPNVFKPFKKRLEVLMLSHNHYLELSNDGYQLHNLRELHLENNGLKSIPNDFFKNMKRIQLINLRHNKLSSLDTPIFESLNLLYSLDLSGNIFTVLPLGILKLPKSLRQLEMSENPWTCDCNQKSLIISYERNYFLERIICATPKEFYNQTFTKKLADDLLCNTTTIATTVKTTEKSNFNEAVSVDEVVVKPFLQSRSNIKMKSDQLVNLDTQTTTEEIAHAGVFQGTGGSWFLNNQWWIICVGCVAFMMIVAVGVIKKVNALRRQREHEPVSLDDEVFGFKTDDL